MIDSGSAPIVVGGTGGSGTRAVVLILDALGVDMGAQRNYAGDLIAMAPFNTVWGRQLLRTWTETHRVLESAAMDLDFQDALQQHGGVEGDRPWGWKNPQSALFLPYIHGRFPSLRFIHTVRDGRDMAFAANQRQQQLYGSILLGPVGVRFPTEVRSAAFWDRANQMTREYGDGVLGRSYHVVRLEDLIVDPTRRVREIAAFCGVDSSPEQLARAAATVARPGTVGRHRWMPAHLRLMVAAACAPGLREYGYALTTSQSVAAALLEGSARLRSRTPARARARARRISERMYADLDERSDRASS